MDQDKAGKEAVNSIKDLFSPQKVKLVTLPEKDAGEMLKQGKVTEFTQCWWAAKSYTPAGIVNIEDTFDAVNAYCDTPSVPYPWVGLNDKLLGQRTPEIVVWAADTGVGK